MTGLRQIAGRVAQSKFAHHLLSMVGRTLGRPLVVKYEDRSLEPPIARGDFVVSVPTEWNVLEIGPYDRPWLSGPSIRYFDVLSQEGLKARAAGEPRRNPDRCPFIHYVSPTGDLSIVDDQFSVVFSSHCVEHQPDLIQHLRDVGRLLRPGGRYYLIVPDKRFCFDHFLPESKIGDVRAAKGRTLHTEKAIADHLLGTTHNIDVLHWLGFHGHTAAGDAKARRRSEDSLKRARAGEYVDVHAWQFTPASFHALIQQLHDEGEIDFEPTRVHNTGFGRIEFMAVLTRAG